MFIIQVQFYNCHHYGHFAKDCTKVWKRKSKEQSEEESENPVYEVNQIHEIDGVKEGRKEHDHGILQEMNQVQSTLCFKAN